MIVIRIIHFRKSYPDSQIVALVHLHLRIQLFVFPPNFPGDQISKYGPMPTSDALSIKLTQLEEIGGSKFGQIYRFQAELHLQK